MSHMPPSWSLTLFIFLIGAAQGGVITPNNSSRGIFSSDEEFGNAIIQEKNIQFPDHHDRLDSSSFTLSGGTCEHLYGFFPCSENVAGHLFEAVLYQYLMGIGGQFVAQGSKKLFTMLGTGVFGASLFRILLNFPRLIFVVMSGAFSSEAEAQQQVAMSVAIYAGSTIFVLTVVWGMIVIFARRDLSEKSCEGEASISTPLLDNQNGGSTSKQLQAKDIVSQLKGTGVTIDEKTSKTAGIMLLSLIPFVVAWIAILLCSSTPSQSHLVILIALIASFASMLAYFVYMLWDPWMQQRSLDYSKFENLLNGFKNYVLMQTNGKLVDEHGQPNIPAIGSLFTENDKDEDKSLTGEEIHKLMEKIQTGEVQVDKDYAVSQVLQVFDLNGDGRISEQEFVEGLKKWVEEASKLEANGEDSSTHDEKSINKFINTFTKKTRDKLNEMEGLMGDVLIKVRSKALEVNSTLLNDDGSPNIDGIQSIFKQFVSVGKDKALSISGLKQLIKTVKFGHEQVNPDETTIKVMKDLRKDGNGVGEFVNAVRTNWLAESDVQDNQGMANKQSTKHKGMKWDEVDNLFKTQQTGYIKEKLQLAWTFGLPILEIIWGVAMLTFLAKPLMSSIISFSFAVGVDSFFISYIIVPVIMNMRVVISAIFPATQNSSKTASLTFSELYGGLITNNLIGLTTVLGIVYAKNLPWDYSAEMLVIIMVSTVVGFFAFFTNTYPLWTCIFAFFLYIFSFALYCVVHYVWGWN